VEQATHLYDLARHLLGEAVVIGAVSNRDPGGSPPGVDVADASAAVLRFERGAIGSFTNSRRIASSVVSVQIASDGLLTTLAKGSLSQGDWHVRFETGDGASELHAKRDPYEVQAVAFLDAVEAGDPCRVLSTYVDALRTDRLTRAVVAATGATG
jgi:predicted dehydrogenase